MAKPPKTIDIKVGGIFIDPMSRTPLLFLINLKENLYFPIWIGFVEAQTIYYSLKNYLSPRPFTAELLYTILRKDLKVEITKVEISDVAGGAYFADLYFKDKEGREYARDCRPSDAIAIGLKARAPISMIAKVAKSFPERERAEFKKLYEYLRKNQRDNEMFKI